MIGRSLLFVVFAVTTATGGAQETLTYTDKVAGFSFEYPVFIKIHTDSAELDRESTSYLFLRIEKLPLERDDAYGWDNENITRLRNGLQDGKLDGFPFHSPANHRILRLSDRYVIENYVFSEFWIGDIQLNHYLLAFNRQYVIFLLLSADPLTRVATKTYVGDLFTFHRQGEATYTWNVSDKEMIQKLEAGQVPLLKNWQYAFDLIAKSLRFF